MDKEKKKWESPKLICLYRGRPEEAVLQKCKFLISGYPGNDPCKAGGGCSKFGTST